MEHLIGALDLDLRLAHSDQAFLALDDLHLILLVAHRHMLRRQYKYGLMRMDNQ